MGIVLITVGRIDRQVMERLKNDLHAALNREVSLGK